VIAVDAHTTLVGLPLHSRELCVSVLSGSACVLIVTGHTEVDYPSIAEHARLVVDTRGVMRSHPAHGRVVGLSGQEGAAAAAPAPSIAALR
jgi:UDP-N-acetyl-D-glucosamine dehydrogenase